MQSSKTLADHRLGGLATGHPRKDQRELVSSDPRGGVRGAESLLQPLPHLLQQLVADGVTEDVVDGLEPVEVQHHQRDTLALAPGALEGLVQAVEKERAIREVGEWVVQ